MNGWIELLRFALAGIIVVYHCSFIAVNRKILDGGLLFQGGSCAVEFFFVLSGYLFARSISRMNSPCGDLGGEALGFVLRKAKRIWPYSLVSSFVILSLDVVCNGGMVGAALGRVWACLPELCFLQQCGLASQSINGHMWYVSAMLITIFALYPFARKFPSLFNRMVAPMVAIVLIGILFQLNHGLGRPVKWNGFMMNGLARAFAEICVGCFCFSIVQRLNVRKPARWVGSSVAIIALTLFLAWLWKPFGGSAFHLLFPVGVLVVVIFSGMVPSIPERLSGLAAFLGSLSLPIYVNQHWAIDIVHKLNPDVIHFSDYVTCVGEVFFLVVVVSALEKVAYSWFLERIRKG